MRLLMADIFTDGARTPEAEPVTVLSWPGSVELVLDDGTRIVLNADELSEAIADRQATGASVA